MKVTKAFVFDVHMADGEGGNDWCLKDEERFVTFPLRNNTTSEIIEQIKSMFLIEHDGVEMSENIVGQLDKQIQDILVQHTEDLATSSFCLCIVYKL